MTKRIFVVDHNILCAVAFFPNLYHRKEQMRPQAGRPNFLQGAPVSTQNTNETLAALIQWLRNRHDAAMAVESQALAFLDAGDTPGHNAAMRQKAELLESMAEDAKPLLESLPGETRFNLALALEGFSASARMSLRLNSVFYMSALLYPDDHKPGQPDNLTLCINRMENLGLDFRTE
jgi:hypothetical protein